MEDSLLGSDDDEDNVYDMDGSLSLSTLLQRWVIFLAFVLVVAVSFIMGMRPSQHSAFDGHQNKWLHDYLTRPKGQVIQQYLEKVSSDPSLAGTEGGEKLMMTVRDHLIKYVPDVQTFEYKVLLSYPKHRSIDILATNETSSRRLQLDEPPLDEDRTSHNPKITQPYIAYSGSGNVSGELVYVNYGRINDFNLLRERGVNLTGCVGLARYGKIFRGLKAKFGEEAGLAALIIYSDPADDGFVKGKVYPNGPYRPSFSVQGGSGHFISLYSGDPLTPGVAAVVDLPASKRKYTSENAPVLPRIPVLAISYSNAESLLLGLRGHSIEKSTWRGGLNVSYDIGPGPIRVNVQADIERRLSSIWNVVGTFTGAAEPNRRVILGNHRDAWIMGAADPHSGTATLMAIAQAFGTMHKGGWRPRRTIQLSSWDAAEFGLIGSTEWAEEFQDVLTKETIAYLNLDVGVAGGKFEFLARASPSIEMTVTMAAKMVPYPGTGKTIYEHWMNTSGGHVGVLGSGSDFSPFLQFLGIASTDISFATRGSQYGVYHSTYDSIDWMELFGDPTFQFHESLAKVWGTMGLLLGGEEILPLSATMYANRLVQYVDQVATLASKLAIHNLNMTFLEYRLADFSRAAARLDAQADNLRSKSQQERAKDGFKVNDRLSFIDRAFLSKIPLTGRTEMFYRHVAFAPALAEGYRSSVLPGITEALLADNVTQAQQHVVELAVLLRKATIQLGQ